ncbi:MAG TPA: glycosyltransferase [Coleofasciculaceae cyanobacterium]
MSVKDYWKTVEMKIAIIASGFLPIIDGVTISGWQRLQILSQQGHEVRFFCPDYSSLSKTYPDWQDYTGDILPGVRVINLTSNSLVGLDYEPNVTRNSYQSVLGELKRFQPDIIHIDQPERLYVAFWRIAGLDYAKQAGIPCISFFRTNFLDYLADYFPLPKPIFTAKINCLDIQLLRLNFGY